MSQSLLAAANDRSLWIIALIVVSVVALQAILYIRLAFSEARKIGFPREKCIRALRSGVISAIGPSFAILIIMVGNHLVLSDSRAHRHLHVLSLR